MDRRPVLLRLLSWYGEVGRPPWTETVAIDTIVTIAYTIRNPPSRAWMGHSHMMTQGCRLLSAEIVTKCMVVKTFLEQTRG